MEICLSLDMAVPDFMGRVAVSIGRLYTFFGPRARKGRWLPSIHLVGWHELVGACMSSVELTRLREAFITAEEAVNALQPSPELLRNEAAEAERLADKNGTPANTSQAVASLERRWRDFLELHGDAYGYNEADGPTIEHAVHFQTIGFHHRVYGFSTTGEEGMSDSWGMLAVPYLLAKYMFPIVGHAGWTGLTEHGLKEKVKPWTLELRTNWTRLKALHARAAAWQKRRRLGVSHVVGACRVLPMPVRLLVCGHELLRRARGDGRCARTRATIARWLRSVGAI